MGITYKKLWHVLIEREITKTALRKKINVSSSTFAKLTNNEYVALTVLEKICLELNCTVDDIMEFVADEKKTSG